MDDRTRKTAEKFNILEKLTAFENDLLSIDRVVDVEFSIDGFYDNINYVIIIPKYNIPVNTKNYFETRKQNKINIINVAKKHGLRRTEDRIEDYGEHWYMVFKCNSEWESGFVKICEKGDYETAYKNYVEFEKGFDCEPEILTFDEFMTELIKGYGNSDFRQIARLKETETGIYYDNEYC